MLLNFEGGIELGATIDVNGVKDLPGYFRVVQINFATMQFKLMGLITVIWLCMGRFMWTTDKAENSMFYRLSCNGWGKVLFFVANAAFQIPLFIWIQVQTFAGDRRDFDFFRDEEVPAQEINSQVKATTAFVNILSALFAFGFVWIMAAQWPAFARKINHSIRSPITRSFIYFLLFVLFLFYVNDVIAMNSYYWGAPAFNMTRRSVTWPSPTAAPDFTNDSPQCLRQILEEGPVDGARINGVASVGGGGWVRFNLAVTQVSAVLWTVVFCFGFFEYQRYGGNKAKGKVHYTYAQKRANRLLEQQQLNHSDR